MPRRLPCALALTTLALAVASASNAGDGNTGGTIFLSGDDADDDNHCHGTLCAGLWPDILEFAVDHSLTGPGGDGLICAVGVNSNFALVALQGTNGNGGWNNTGDAEHPGPNAGIEHFLSADGIETFDLSACTVLYIPSAQTQTPGGITASQLAALNTRQGDIVNFVNVQGGALVALTEAEMPGAYGWLPLEIQTADEEHFLATVTKAMLELFPDITNEDVSRPPGDAAPRYHTIFTGPEGFLGLEVLIREDDPDQSDGAPLMLGGFQVIIEDCTENADCDDGNDCTDDVCTDSVCESTDNTADCDDGDACTDGDVCAGGECAGTAVDCNDKDECTDDACVAGICVNLPADCDDGNACTEDSCDPASGCVHDDVDCDDNDPCTNESCDDATGCVFEKTDCDDADECTKDFCLPGLGCINSPIDQCECPADLNGDGFVDAEDLATLLGSWGPCGPCPADLFVDGIIDASDLAILLGAWGPCE